MKTEQTTIVYAQWDRWTSYDVIKHHMITTDVTLKGVLGSPLVCCCQSLSFFLRCEMPKCSQIRTLKWRLAFP